MRVILGFVLVSASAVLCINRVWQPDNSARLRNVPLHLQKVPLSRALDTISANLDNGDVVLFGVEVYVDHGLEPQISVDISSGATVTEALQTVLSELPDYGSEPAGTHIINV